MSRKFWQNVARKYDLESLISDIQKILATNFNAKLVEINAEKADGITLDAIDDGAYVLQTLNGEIANYDPLIFYGVENIETAGNGPTSSSRYTISVIVVVADNGQDINIGPRMFRYSRALEETINENWSAFGTGAARLELTSKVPVPFTDMNTNQPCRAVGVSLVASLA